MVLYRLELKVQQAIEDSYELFNLIATNDISPKNSLKLEK